jgi:hypothetical protein
VANSRTCYPHSLHEVGALPAWFRPVRPEPSSKWAELVDLHLRSDRKLLANERQALRYVIETATGRGTLCGSEAAHSRLPGVIF